MSNPSPLCEIKVGAAAYVTAVGGVDMALSTTIIIKLSSQTDVDTWLVECVTTDDTSDAATVTASLTIDAVARTATFTAPGDTGKAYRFRSRVNGGINRNNVVDTALETTFCLYTQVNGRRVVATDETTEGDATFGWIVWLNDIIRTNAGLVGGQGGAGGSTNQVQYNAGGSFLGATGLNYNPTTMRVDARINTASIVSAAIGQATITSANLVSAVIPTASMTVANIGQATIVNENILSARIATAVFSGLSSRVATFSNAMLGGIVPSGFGCTGATGVHLVTPVLYGAILAATTVYTGLDMVADGLVDHKPFSLVRTTTTTDATVKNLFAWKVLDEAVSSVVVEANVVPSGAAAGGSYARRVMIRSKGGVATCGTLEYSWADEHTASGIGFTGLAIGTGINIGASGATGFVNLKGGATAILKWGVTVTVQPTRFA
jgi:hypothetical protein